MKLYLSSYMFGDKQEEIPKLMPKDNKKIGLILNAYDLINVNLEHKKRKKLMIIKELESLKLEVEILDLRQYFGKQEKLSEKLSQLGGIFLIGGNVFILRQAMKLSGFDKIFHEELKNRKDFLYSGFSAGICVLAPSLNGLDIVDKSDEFPYSQNNETIWEGLGYLDYVILPHYKSDHPESEDVDKTVEYCEQNKIKYKTLRDGEVIIIE